jgi:phosphatidylserine decarboxylase
MKHPIVMREGWPFVGGALLLGVILAGLGGTLSAAAAGLLALFCLWFFRNPSRVIPEAEDAVVSPGDGKVLKVEPVRAVRWIDGEATQVSVFLNVFDVHVNRTPIGGKVLAADYRPGRFFNASFDKASEHNERNTICIEDGRGRRVIFRQIAGLVARRIVCYLRAGDEAARGEVMGLIRFGSRVEIVVPREARIAVRPGERVRGGSTVVAWLP